MAEKVKLVSLSIKDGYVMNGQVFNKNQRVVEGFVELEPEIASHYFKSILGHAPKDGCKCAPVSRVLTQTSFYAIAEDSEYGLDSCKKVVRGGWYNVDADSVIRGEMILKPKTGQAIDSILDKSKESPVEKTKKNKNEIIENF